MTTKITVSIEHDSALPKDRVVNTFHVGAPFIAGTPVRVAVADRPLVVDALEAFYNADPGAVGIPIANFLSNHLNRAMPVQVRFYDAKEAPFNAGAPYYTDTFVLGVGAAAADLPSEVAVCLSWSADLIGGVDVRRLRGRTFLGPLNEVLVTDQAGGIRIDTSVVTGLAITQKKLVDDLEALGVEARLAIFSGGPYKTGTPQQPQANFVTKGHVDNAFDTIRKRGEAASSRSTWVT